MIRDLIRSNIILVLSLSFSTIYFSSCSSEFSSVGPALRGGRGSIPPTYVSGGEVGQASRRGLFPWEAWLSVQDAMGSDVNDPYIRKGDELLKAARRDEALNYYLRAQSTTMPFSAKQGLALRIASTQLALDRAKESLVTLSKFFRDNSLDATKVDSPFALVFAYAYGRSGDLEQSLAWFSRLAVGQGDDPHYKQSASLGATLLLRTVDNFRLNDLDTVWNADPFVSALIGQERARRSRLGSSFEVAKQGEPFWAPVAPTGAVVSAPSYPLDISGSPKGSVVGTLLPLSGRYSNLGQSTLRGVELALLDSGVQLIAKDDLGEPSTAVAAVSAMLAEAKPSIIIGPLLSETAAVTAPLIKEQGVPQLSLSRKELPSYGYSAFQLGASTSAQVESLLRVTSDTLGLKRYAIIYPQDSSGFEFLREFRRVAAELGLGISYEASYGEDYRQSFVRVAEEVERSDSQAIFFPEDIDKATVLLTNLSPSYKRQVRILGSAAWDDHQRLASSRTILEGAVFVSPFFGKSTRELVVRFNDIYEKRYGSAPDFLAAQGFDAATLVLAALSREQREGTPFLTGFRAIDTYQGLTGEITMEPDGHFRRQFSVVELSDRGLKEVR